MGCLSPHEVPGTFCFGAPAILQNFIPGLLGQFAAGSSGVIGLGADIGASLFNRITDNIAKFGRGVVSAGQQIISFGQKILEGFGSLTKAGFSKAVEFFSGIFDRHTTEVLTDGGTKSLESTLNSSCSVLTQGIHCAYKSVNIEYLSSEDRLIYANAEINANLKNLKKVGEFFSGNIEFGDDSGPDGIKLTQSYAEGKLWGVKLFDDLDVLIEMSPLDAYTPLTFDNSRNLFSGKLIMGNTYYTLSKGVLIEADNIVIGDNEFMSRLWNFNLPSGGDNPFSGIMLSMRQDMSGVLSPELKIPDALKGVSLSGFSGLNADQELMDFAHRFIDDVFVADIIDLKDDVVIILDQPHIRDLEATMDIKGGIAAMAAGLALLTGGAGLSPFTGGASISAIALGGTMFTKGFLDVGSGMEKLSQDSGVSNADYLTLDDLIGAENSRNVSIVEGVKNRYDDFGNFSRLGPGLGSALLGAAHLFVALIEYYEDNYYENYSNN